MPLHCSRAAVASSSATGGKNEFELARILGDQYRFCFVCLHPDSPGFSLVSEAELQGLIRTKPGLLQLVGVFELLLIDDDTGLKNRNLHFMLDDGARAACQLRHEGRRVLIHCVNAESRSPSVAARYGVLRGHTADDARKEVQAALDAWHGPFMPNPHLWRAVGDLGENRVGCDQCPYRDGKAPVAADDGAFHPCV